MSNLQLIDGYRLFHAGALALARAERAGFRFDVDKAEQAKKKLTDKINKLHNELLETDFCKEWQKNSPTTINVYSNPQLGQFLYKIKKIKPTKKTKSGSGSTDEDTLRSLNIPALNILLRIRKLKKLRDTYLDQFIREQVDDKIHPFFNLHTVRTYRSSSDSPNFQNIPVRDNESKKIIRSTLYPRKGHILCELDYKSLEVCISACYHKDPMMIKYVSDPTTDMHGDMASQIFMLKIDKSKIGHSVLRNAAKNAFVFPQFYGDYYGNNARSLLDKWCDMPTNRKFKETDGKDIEPGLTVGQHLINEGIKHPKDFIAHIKDIEDHFWNERFKVYNDWKKRWWHRYRKLGYFDLLTGFRCSGVMSRNDALNYPIQGSAFHCLLWSFIRLDEIMRKEKWDTKLIGQIHDSIILDVNPFELDHVLNVAHQVTSVDLLEAWDWIIVPLRIEVELCDIDQSWDTKKELKKAA